MKNTKLSGFKMNIKENLMFVITSFVSKKFKGGYENDIFHKKKKQTIP
ncbi:hypothetical protein LEP1GSC038_0137 [Leptospira weilii str. 2006001855]|uniref:Uncharacterized protein n=1 Tax=Leptospira weilii str. 2006001855 TaxID=996804 RepID=M6FSE5_9LEPT|nr:hypothetical protein LEP1GSC038_0137 [Leptospira weilii str. 2006001855]EMN44105.1 hypothetical protein LEP1GSC086_0885 [Leptospira weilii str. LNT 1234]